MVSTVKIASRLKIINIRTIVSIVILLVVSSSKAERG